MKMLDTLDASEPAVSAPCMAESLLSIHDSTLGRVIASQSARWPSRPTEDPIWGSFAL